MTIIISESRARIIDYRVEDFISNISHEDIRFPSYFITKDGTILSYDSARKNKEKIINAIENKNDDKWQVVDEKINYDDNLICDFSGEKIGVPINKRKKNTKKSEKEIDKMTFLGYHSSSSNIEDGMYKGDVLDEERYPELIRDIYWQIIALPLKDEDDIEKMNQAFKKRGMGFTFVSDEPIMASAYQYSKNKYGDYLYKVYGNGNETILNDHNEVNAEIIISKKPLYFKKVDE